MRFQDLLRLASILLLGGLYAVTCAPSSKAARGAVGDQVRSAIETGTGTFDHAEWDRLLALGTRDGLVDYDAFERERAALEAYLGRIAEADLASLDAPHLKALLINAYNAYTVQSILDHPGISSIREIDGVWSDRTHAVGGFQLTLDALEHNLLRPYFQDPRIHMAVNCASMSCAPLPPWAFTGERIEAQLEEWTERFFRDPKYTRVEDGTLKVSKLLDWYGSDFTDPEADPRADSIPLFVARYAGPETARFIEDEDGDPDLEFLPYDWSLNRATDS